jgi:hypothetical protein
VSDVARSVSMELSRAIFDDAIRAYTEVAHPCHAFRYLQVGVQDDRWQLPEPFNGRSADAGIVFLGLNPSYDPGEPVPTVGSSFEEWDGYYRARFDRPSREWHKLYRRYQAVGEVAVGSEFRLGRDAIVLEAVRFRSASGQGCADPAVFEHEFPLTERLLSELAPRVVVANGSDALWATQMLWPALQREVPLGTRLLAVEHRRFGMDTPWGRVAVVPTRHLSAAFGFRLEMLTVLAEVVAGALRG